MSVGLRVFRMPRPLVFMSFEDMSPDITGTPSSTNRGWLLALIEPSPRTVIDVLAPGVPVTFSMFTPERLPSIICESEITGRSFCLSVLITDAEPV